jgi:hypothetical protein
MGVLPRVNRQLLFQGKAARLPLNGKKVREIYLPDPEWTFLERSGVKSLKWAQSELHTPKRIHYR